ncbi:sigma-70 family RNA polymerase sigma factor [Clostridium sediminicola]|uniref:sigma-70 family RNA polymerase sigma factor n=1 Tax=Clostridium sediminicola TaxID=3114879 RepID=UPI0031F20BD4
MDIDMCIEAIRNKDASALEQIMNEYGKFVYALAYRILNGLASKEDIEECVSDVFVSVWNDIDDFSKSRGSFKTWILIKTKYKALDYRRKLSKAENKISIEENLVYLNKNIGENSVEKKILLKEEMNTILTNLNKFNKLDREIFIRRYFYYEDIKDIAKKKGLTRQAVDNRLFRMRTKLKGLEVV